MKLHRNLTKNSQNLLNPYGIRMGSVRGPYGVSQIVAVPAKFRTRPVCLQLIINFGGEAALREIVETKKRCKGIENLQKSEILFDYIVDLNRTRNDEGKFMDINEIMKMDFKQEFLPGVAKYAREMAIARQTRSSGNRQKQAEPDTDIHQGPI